MQLNEVIEENSIATISKRTRISVENIEKLVNGDFSGMNRVKALGFISILEREFNLDLSALKKECLETFPSGSSEEFDARLVVTMPEPEGQGGGKLPKVFLLLLLAALGYGSWYFLADKQGAGIEDNRSVMQTSGFVDSVVSQVRTWIGSTSSLGGEINATVLPTDEVWAKTEQEKNDTQSNAVGIDTEDSREIFTTEENDSRADEKIIRDAKNEQEKIIAQAMEDNGTGTVFPAEETLLSPDDAPAIVSDMPLAVEVPSMAAVTKTNEIVALQREKKSTESKTKKTETKKISKKKLGKKIVVLHPSKKVWVGYTDLKTMKRAAKVIEDDIVFDTAESQWILVAGHNAITFLIGKRTVTPKKRDKNYFLIKKGKVKEISKEEFQQLNKSTVW